MLLCLWKLLLLLLLSLLLLLLLLLRVSLFSYNVVILIINIIINSLLLLVQYTFYNSKTSTFRFAWWMVSDLSLSAVLQMLTAYRQKQVAKLLHRVFSQPKLLFWCIHNKGQKLNWYVLNNLNMTCSFFSFRLKFFHLSVFW